MKVYSKQSSLAVYSFALLLLLPAVFSVFVDKELFRETQRRDLAKSPNISQLASTPSRYFHSLSDWLSDRTGGVLLSKNIMARTQYYVFNDPPSKEFVLGENGEFFLHTFNVQQPFLVPRICFRKRQEQMYEFVTQNLRHIQSKLAERSVEVRTLVIPSKFSIYGESLGRGVPVQIKEACVKTGISGSAFEKVNDLKDLNILYPIDIFRANKNNPNFYPIGNFHWHGESVHLAIKEWVATFSKGALSSLDGSYTVEPIENDVGHLVNFKRQFSGKVYDYSDHGVTYPPSPARGMPSIKLIEDKWGYSKEEDPVFNKGRIFPVNLAGIDGFKHQMAIYIKRKLAGRFHGYFHHGMSHSISPYAGGTNINTAEGRLGYSEAKNPVFDERVLLLTNSFGVEGFKHLSAVYSELMWINMNILSDQDFDKVMNEYIDVYQPDAVMILTHNVAIRRRVKRISEALK